MRLAPYIVLPVLPVLLAACGDDPKDTANPSDTAQQPVLEEGTWYIGFGAVLANDCDDLVTPEDPGEMEVALTGASAFTITDTDGAFTCTLTGSDYTCDPRETGRTAMDPLAAEMVATITLAGSFSSPTETSGTSNIAITCEGADCGQVEDTSTVPCAVDMEFTGSRVTSR